MAKEANWLRREADVACFLSTARKLREIADRIEALELAVWRQSREVTLEELKLADKHCDWVAFKHAFNAVMKARRDAEASNGEKA